LNYGVRERSDDGAWIEVRAETCPMRPNFFNGPHDRLGRRRARATIKSTKDHLLLLHSETQVRVNLRRASLAAALQMHRYVTCAPCASTYTEYSDWLAAIKRRFRFSPPKQRFAQISGNRIIPMRWPSGANMWTPS